MRRLLHAVLGHSWTVHLVDEDRAVMLMQLDPLAGAFATCPCGATRDDLSEEARHHFIRSGRLRVNFSTGDWEVSR